MLVLALDTTTRGGSCALASNGVVLREVAGDPAQSHAEHLPGDLIALLAREAIAPEAIDIFAVATGPGSFTGLRVGIATMQGLAFAMGKPLIGISALDALAHVARRPSAGRHDAAMPGRHGDTDGAERTDPPDAVATWVDAWRGEIYAALYEAGREVEAPTVEHPEKVLARLTSYVATARKGEGVSRTICFIGDGAATFAELIRARLSDTAVIANPPAPLIAGAVAVLATTAARAGVHPEPGAVRPLYVRRTDAELARDARPVG